MKTKIVVVEDDTVQRELYEVILGRSGDITVCARFGDAASAMAWNGWTDANAVLCDWMLPKTSGEALLDWLERHHPHVRRVVVTAVPDKALRTQAARSAHAVLAKPYQPRDLEEAIRGV